MTQTTPNGDNYSSWSIKNLDRDKFESLPVYDKLLYLCQLGHLAPSTHNTQPWRLAIDEKENAIDIYLDKKYILPASDVVGRQAATSIGCLLANIKLAAEYFGLKNNIEQVEQDKKMWKPDKEGGEEKFLVCSIKFTKGSVSKTLSPIPDILERKVMRVEFDPQKLIEEKVIKEMESIVKNYTNLKLHIVTDPVRKLAISEFQGQADGFVINSRKFSKELGEWLLPNDTNSYIGMPGTGFGLQAQEADRLHKGLLGEINLEPEDGLRFSMLGKIGIEKSPMICFITADKDEVQNWLSAGQAFEELFLTLTKHKINVSVHAGIVEVSLINKMFAATIGTTRKILVLFRAGYVKKEADKNRPHSPRQKIEDVLIKV